MKANASRTRERDVSRPRSGDVAALALLIAGASLAAALAASPALAGGSCITHATIEVCEWSYGPPHGLPHQFRVTAGGGVDVFRGGLAGGVPLVYYSQLEARTEWPTGEARLFGVLFLKAWHWGPFTAAEVHCEALDGRLTRRCYVTGPFLLPLP